MKQQLTNTVSLVLICLLATQTLAQQCPLSASNKDLLQAGTTDLFNHHSSSSLARQHKYQFNLEFQVPIGRSLQVAASPLTFDVNLNSGLDFLVWGGPGPSVGTGLLIVLLDEDNTWNTVRVSYLASARSDFFLGTFSAAMYLPQSTSNGIVMINHGIANWTPSQHNFISIVELAGAKTAAKTFSIALTKVTLDKTSGVMTVETSLSSTPAFEFVVITYVVFSPAIPLTYSPYSGGPLPTYLFSGIDQLQTTASPVIASFGFTSSASGTGLTCVGASCPSACISSQNCVSLGGIITLAQQCALCGSGEVFSNGQCISQVTCGDNQYFNGQTCVCNPNYQMANGFCVLKCGPSYVNVNGVCVKQCGPNEHLEGQDCVCDLNYMRVNGVCEEACKFGFTLVNGQCVCQPPFGFLGTQCKSCLPNGHRGPNNYCVCDPGYQFDSSFTCVSKCPEHSQLNSQGDCQCDQGYFEYNEECIQDCPEHSSWNGYYCICDPGYHFNGGGVCIQCPVNEEWDGYQCICKEGYSRIGGVCKKQCPPNSQWNGQECQCKTGYFKINENCQKCPVNSFFDPNKSKCVCHNGFFQDSNKECPPCHDSCVTCYGPTASNCLNCSSGIPNNGRCHQVCNASQYVDKAGQCRSCMPNCIFCYNGFTCTICNLTYTVQKINQGGNIIVSCQKISSGATHIIALQGDVIAMDKKDIYQGVSLSDKPYSLAPTNTLLKIDVSVSGITVSQRFISSPTYRSVIKFSFPSTTTIPAFEFTIRINPSLSSYFSSGDMAQVLKGAFNQQSITDFSPVSGSVKGVLTSSIPVSTTSNQLGSATTVSTASYRPILGTSASTLSTSLTPTTPTSTTPTTPAPAPAPTTTSTSSTGLSSEMLSQLFGT